MQSYFEVFSIIYRTNIRMYLSIHIGRIDFKDKIHLFKKYYTNFKPSVDF